MSVAVLGLVPVGKRPVPQQGHGGSPVTGQGCGGPGSIDAAGHHIFCALVTMQPTHTLSRTNRFDLHLGNFLIYYLQIWGFFFPKTSLPAPPSQSSSLCGPYITEGEELPWMPSPGEMRSWRLCGLCFAHPSSQRCWILHRTRTLGLDEGLFPGVGREGTGRTRWC